MINVAVGGRISLNELLAMLQGIIGTSLTPTYGPTREGDVRDSQADIRKARACSATRRLSPFEEGLRHTVAWFRES